MPENAENTLAALAQVAAAGAKILVTAMTAHRWREVRERVAGLVSRGDRRCQALQRQLMDESRRRIVSAPPSQRSATRASEQDRWEAALLLALVLDQGLALDLAILADDLVTRLAPPAEGPAGPPWRAAPAGDPAVAPRARLALVTDVADPADARADASRDFRP